MSQYIVEISQTEEQILLNDLVDVQTWLNEAILGRINCSKKEMANAEKQLLTTEGAEFMPMSIDILCQNYMNRPTYQNREQRDAAARQAIIDRYQV